MAQYAVGPFLQARDSCDDDDQLTAATKARVDGAQIPPRQPGATTRERGDRPLAVSGVDTTPLGNSIADLGGLTLGRVADGANWLDNNAAGCGWFVDRTQFPSIQVRVNIAKFAATPAPFAPAFPRTAQSVRLALPASSQCSRRGPSACAASPT